MIRRGVAPNTTDLFVEEDSSFLHPMVDRLNAFV